MFKHVQKGIYKSRFESSCWLDTPWAVHHWIKSLVYKEWFYTRWRYNQTTSVIKFWGVLAGVRSTASGDKPAILRGSLGIPICYSHISRSGNSFHEKHKIPSRAPWWPLYFTLVLWQHEGRSFTLSFFDMTCLTDENSAEVLTHLACDLILDVGIQTVSKSTCTAEVLM